MIIIATALLFYPGLSNFWRAAGVLVLLIWGVWAWDESATDEPQTTRQRLRAIFDEHFNIVAMVRKMPTTWREATRIKHEAQALKAKNKEHKVRLEALRAEVELKEAEATEMRRQADLKRAEAERTNIISRALTDALRNGAGGDFAVLEASAATGESLEDCFAVFDKAISSTAPEDPYGRA